VRDPLIPPLIAVATGILFSRLFQFSMAEAAWPVAAFLGWLRRMRRVNVLLALVFFARGLKLASAGDTPGLTLDPAKR